ncbi:MAG: AMP-binding protein, partial [Rikenellaceae bacterium]|nr:AMP-binding protein [Rikenellaceae bacterium]
MKSMFEGIGKIRYEGADSKNPLAFRWYDENRVILGKTMKEHLRFAVAYWHSFCAQGGDQFGGPTIDFPWNAIVDPVERAKAKMDSAFDFMVKIGAPYYCFHDVDLVDDSGNPVPPGEVGELVLRVPEDKKQNGLFRGYYKDPDLTA